MATSTPDSVLSQIASNGTAPQTPGVGRVPVSSNNPYGLSVTPDSNPTDFYIPTPTPTSKPTTVVSSNTAANQAETEIKPALQQGQSNLNVANYTQSMKAQGLNNDGTPIVPPVTTPPPTTNGANVPTPQNPETDLQNQVAHPGQTQYYNTQNGQQEWVTTPADGSTPSGYSATNPQTSPVVSTVTDPNGVTYNQYADGHYGIIDQSGNYSATTAGVFSTTQQNNQAVTQAKQALANLNNGILTPAQQNQVTSLNQTFENEISKFTFGVANDTSALNSLNGLGTVQSGPTAITQLIVNGTQDIQDAQNAQGKALADLEKGFQTDDTDAINTAYAQYKDSSDSITKNISDTLNAIQAQAKSDDDKLTSWTLTQMTNHPDANITLGMSQPQIEKAVTDSQTFKEKQTIVDTTPVTGDAPDPATADVPSSITGLTGNELWGMGTQLALSGKPVRSIIGVALGGGPVGAAAVQAVNAKSYAMMKAAGVNPAVMQQEYKANSLSLDSLTDNMNTISAAAESAQSGANVLVKLLSQDGVNTYTPTYLNQTLNSLINNFGNKANLGQYQAELKEISNDYGLVFSRGGASTDATNASADAILNGNMTLKDLISVTDGLQDQAGTVINSNIAQMQKTANGGTDEVAKFLQYVNNAPVQETSTNSTPAGSTSPQVFSGTSW